MKWWYARIQISSWKEGCIRKFRLSNTDSRAINLFLIYCIFDQITLAFTQKKILSTLIYSRSQRLYNSTCISNGSATSVPIWVYAYPKISWEISIITFSLCYTKTACMKLWGQHFQLHPLESCMNKQQNMCPQKTKVAPRNGKS